MGRVRCSRRALAGALVAAILAATRVSAADGPPIRMGAPLTHPDWMLRDGAAWGPEGIRRMLDACKASGWSRVYWRAMDGGRALYRSRFADPQGPWEADSFWSPARPEDRRLVESFGIAPGVMARVHARLDAMDYSGLDTLAEAVRYGHSIGLEVHAWVTINEDDHGWGIRSRFARAHPETRWVRRDGTPYRSQQSFAFPEVMRYKLALVEEVLSGYAVDGLLLDWLRTGDGRDDPQTDADGVADHGYEAPLVAAFRAEHAIDPASLPNGDGRWVRARARPQTEFMRGVRALVAARRPGSKVSVLVAHPWCYRGLRRRIDGNLRGLLLDLPAWAGEGLIDEAAAAGYYLEGGSPEAATRALQAETGGRVGVWLYAWMPRSAEEFERQYELARGLGVAQILFWEADYLDDGRPREAIQRAMRARAGEGHPGAGR